MADEIQAPAAAALKEKKALVASSMAEFVDLVEEKVAARFETRIAELESVVKRPVEAVEKDAKSIEKGWPGFWHARVAALEDDLKAIREKLLHHGIDASPEESAAPAAVERTGASAPTQAIAK